MTGFLAEATALDAAAVDLQAQAERLNALRGTVAGVNLPPGAFGMLPQSREVSDAYGSCRACLADQLAGYASATRSLSTSVTTSAGGYRRGDGQAATGYQQLAGFGDVPGRLAGTAASTVDTHVPGLGTGSFADRIAANRTAIEAELDAEQRRLARFEVSDPDGEATIASRARVELYQSIIAEDRKILRFDPSGDGAMVELVGDLTADTRNVAVYVPGTTSELATFERFHDGAVGFVEAAPHRDLAVVVWMDGDFPDNLVPNSASASYAQELAPRLAAFSHELRGEVQGPAAANDVQITYVGHSYGGPVVGTAEQLGLDADRVLHLASAGMGHDVHGPADLRPAQPDVQRFALTAPGDPIAWVRDINIGNWGHGADPEEFPGVVHLEAGNYADGRPLEGTAAHVDVLSYHSDAWWNIYHVFTGGPLQMRPAP
jgi:Alpha/beta hydrolase